MNSRLPILALCLILVSQGIAQEKKTKKKGGSSTLPPKSPMLQVSAEPDSVIQAKDANGLFTTQLGGRDLEFFRSLIGAGQLQVLLGDLVKSKAQSDQVKTVGGALVSAQPEENRQVIQLAGLNQIVPSPEAASGPRKTSAELEKLSGANFDKAFADRIAGAIQDTVRAYEAGADSNVPEIKSFAEQMLPISKERLLIAEKMLADVKSAVPLSTPALHASPVRLRTSPALPSNPSPSPPPLTLGTGEHLTPLLGTPAPVPPALTLDPAPPPPPVAPSPPPSSPSKPASPKP